MTSVAWERYWLLVMRSYNSMVNQLEAVAVKKTDMFVVAKIIENWKLEKVLDTNQVV